MSVQQKMLLLRSLKGLGRILMAGVLAAAVTARGADWPQWGGKNSRNMISEEKGLPDFFKAEVGRGTAQTTASVDGETRMVWPAQSGIPGTNLKWAARLATKAYSSPVVSGGKVFIGANSETHYDPRRNERMGGALLCFEEQTGKFLWQLIVPRYITRDPLFNYDKISYGVLSTPVVEGNRVYIVSNRDELMCLDTEGQANGNDGPFQDEAKLMVGAGKPAVPLAKTDGDIVWRIDMLTNPDVAAWPQDADDCSILILGDYLYVCPSNGVNKTHIYLPRPEAPSLIVVDKRTGKIVARDDARIGPHIIHGEWSSPTSGVVNGKELLFWGGGDGTVYAMDPKPTPPAPGERLGRLKVLWRFNVNVAAGRLGKYRTVEGPSEIIATPVFYKNRIYIDVGQDPTHGRGRGELVCIDATRTGDITTNGAVWLFKGIDRSLSTVAIADGLLYVGDNSGRVFCLDADTGKQYWMHDTRQAICSSPMVADGKVYIGTDAGVLWVFKAGKELKVINQVRLDSTIEATCAAANGTLFVGTLKFLYAAALGK